MFDKDKVVRIEPLTPSHDGSANTSINLNRKDCTASHCIAKQGLVVDHYTACGQQLKVRVVASI